MKLIKIDTPVICIIQNTPNTYIIWLNNNIWNNLQIIHIIYISVWQNSVYTNNSDMKWHNYANPETLEISSIK